MMNVTKRFFGKIGVFILILLLCCCVCACGTDKAQTENTASQEVEENTFQSVAYLQKFENFKDMYNCGFESFYGKVDLVADHKTEGNTAAKMSVETLQYQYSTVYVHLDAKRTDYGYDLSDLSKIEFLNFSLYNDNDADTQITLTVTGVDGSTLINENLLLGGKSGTDWRIRVDRAAMTLKGEAAKEYRLTFGNTTGVWYLDNFYAELAYDPIAIPKKDFGSDTILNFDDVTDVYFVTSGGVNVSTFWDMQYGIVSDKGIAKDGTMLKLRFSRTLSGNNDEIIQPKLRMQGIQLSDYVYKNFDFTRLTNRALSVDVYSCSSKEETVCLYLGDMSGVSVRKTAVLQPLAWTTVTLPYSDISGTSLNLKSINAAGIYFEYQAFDGEPVFYLDNLKLV